jgi:cytochrome c
MEKYTMNYFLTVFIGLTGVLFTYPSQASDLATKTYTTYVTKTGKISLPENYRPHWSHLGSWVVNDAKAPGYGFHDVYTQPEVVKAFLETGQFPDGTVLIKEIRKISSRTLTTGPALWASDTAVWFVMIKDTKGRFKGNVNWGEGWGWALFEAPNRNIDTSKGYLQSCLPCHVPAKQTDWVYIEGYPTLRPQ